ncbi:MULTISPECIES: hypothetical protein [Pontibacillus]|uniref:Uncharacterized protein n=1 Tax=Pontibacillus chungwhensis TaxID=265426 RepID=A0ABY8UVM9_9BACI|nr:MULTISPECIES: hypothetical protein [Pontibacillus]WIF97725.1 hypothetical protein QNI29_18670 [Pontibacillus chungwhensis]
MLRFMIKELIIVIKERTNPHNEVEHEDEMDLKSFLNSIEEQVEEEKLNVVQRASKAQNTYQHSALMMLDHLTLVYFPLLYGVLHYTEELNIDEHQALSINQTICKQSLNECNYIHKIFLSYFIYENQIDTRAKEHLLYLFNISIVEYERYTTEPTEKIMDIFGLPVTPSFKKLVTLALQNPYHSGLGDKFIIPRD